MNQKLEWLVIVEFAVSAMKVSPFIVNYRSELKMRADIRRKKKVEKVIEFVKRMKKVQKEAGAALRKVQKKIKQ